MGAGGARAQTTTPEPVPPPQGDFSGSVASQAVSGVVQLSLQDAIDRGLKQNLGALLRSEGIGEARGERWQQLSALLPKVTVASYEDTSQADLAEFGFSFKFPGVSIPTVVGPFTYFDSRADLTQTVFDWKAINRSRESVQSLKAAQYTYKDARDLVVLVVGYAYLQAIADEARIETAQAQQDTAQALYNQASDQVKAGTSPNIDALRAQVQFQTQQQQLIQAQNQLSIQKLTLARAIGLAPGQQFELTDKSPYQPFDGITVEEALKRAYESRSDYRSAMADVRAGEYSRKAAMAGYYPSLAFSADYGVAGAYSNLFTHGVFDVRTTLTIPIFEGGSVHGDVLQADARLSESRDRLENLHGQIDQDVRTALFNIQSAAEEVAVAQSNIDLAEQTLTQSRDRFVAGVTNTVEVVQSQQAVASAHEQYISSLYNYNYAKISLARAMGTSEQGVKDYFKGK